MYHVLKIGHHSTGHHVYMRRKVLSNIICSVSDHNWDACKTCVQSSIQYVLPRPPAPQLTIGRANQSLAPRLIRLMRFSTQSAGFGPGFGSTKERCQSHLHGRTVLEIENQLLLYRRRVPSSLLSGSRFPFKPTASGPKSWVALTTC